MLELEERLEAEAQRLSEALYQIAGEPREDGDPEAARRRSALIGLRRALHNRCRVAPESLADIPPAMATDIAEHLDRRTDLQALREDYVRVYKSGLVRTRRALLAIARQPAFREGIRLVSRSLLDRMGKLERLDPGRWRHDERHAGAKLAAYAARFATKTSPNAVFCATALAGIGGGEARVSGSNGIARLDVLLSVAEARKISACLAADRASWPAIVPRLNPTLRRKDGVWEFWRALTLRRESDDEVLSRTPEQEILGLFFEEAGSGALAIPDLLARVAERYEIEVEELIPFFEQLVEKGVLIAEIEPPYNERRPLRFVAEAMRAAGCDAPWLAGVEEVEREVDALPGLAPEDRIVAMDRLESRLSALPHTRPIKGDDLFRLDAASAVEVTLPERVRADLEGPLRRYVRLFASLYPEMAFREAWGRRFLSRFPADTDVPILDLYHGLFEPENQERPDAFPQAPPGASDAEAALERARDRFARRAREALAAGEDEVALTDEDWDHLAGGVPEPVWTAGALFQIAAGSPEDVSAGRYRLALNALFGAGIGLARFAWLHGDAILPELERSWAPVMRPGAVLAEVTFNHFSRTANAGLRPSLYRHEIELLGDRASAGAEVIPLGELTVRWDAASRRFALRWAARGVEVVPVISSGISPEGFVSFLVEIGRQGLQPLAWFPGFDVPGISRWPRFTSGKLVLFRQRWVFAPGEAPETPREGGDPEAAGAEFFARTVRWRRSHGLPRHVFLHTAAEPKPFYADLDSPLSVDLLRRTLTPAKEGGAPPALHVVEMLPGPDEMWVRDERGRYATEFLLHFSGPAF
ncbi:MAG: lantibiotic dehydratase [Thermoanaerobaculia bacterium]